MKYILFSVLFIGLTQTHFAQSSSEWDLQKCIDQAQKHNISLKQSEITTQINKNNSQNLSNFLKVLGKDDFIMTS